MSITILFKTFFIHIIKFAHNYDIKFILKLIYPSLKSIKKIAVTIIKNKRLIYFCNLSST